MFEWFGVTSEANIEKYDTGLIENWQPLSQEDSETVVFEKSFNELKIDDEFAKRITSHQFQLLFVNAEDMKVKEAIEFDFSQLLSFRENQKPQVIYKNDSLSIMEIDQFEFILEADKCLISKEYRHYLNPFEVAIIGAKEMPYPPDKSYNPVYVQYNFFDGTFIKTRSVLHNQLCRWDAKHVFLAGFMDQTQLAETLNSQYLKMEIHDRDEIQDDKIKEETQIIDYQALIDAEEERNKPKEDEIPVKGKQQKGKAQPPQKQEKQPIAKDDKSKKKDTKKKDAKLGEPIFEEKPQEKVLSSNFGVACFSLINLLKPNIRHLKLRSPIYPNKKYEDFESNNLDLNSTAKKDQKRNYISSSYLDNGAYLVIGLDMPFPLNSYRPPVEIIDQQVNQLASLSKDKREKKDPKQAEIKAEQEEKKETSVPQEQVDKEPFERAVYIMPYKCKQFITALQDQINQTNLQAFNLNEGGLRALTTYALSQEEKINKTLDFIGGFEIIDNEYRIFLVEGLREGAMKKLDEVCFRREPNTEKFKILKNSKIRFQERMYQDFNIDIKKIRLRENLKDILMNPNIYLRTKVAESIQNTLIQINELKKQNNMRQISQFNYFPDSKVLVHIERKYGDSLSKEDIFGYEFKVQKSQKQTQAAISESTGITTENEQDNKEKGVKFENVDQKPDQEIIKIEQEVINASSLPKIGKTLTFPPRQKREKAYKLQIKEVVSNIAGDDVYIYGQQKNNWYVQQMTKMQEQIQKDPHNFYTYSLDYLSLSISPFDEEERKKAEILKEKQLMSVKKLFQSQPKKTKEERMKLSKKPPASVIDDIRNDPWHQSTQRKEFALTSQRGNPLKDPNKKEFTNFITKKIECFSQPAIIKEQLQTAAEKETEDRQKLLKEREIWKSKLKGTEYIYTYNKSQDMRSQLDKIQGLLHQKPIKKGLLLKNKRILSSKIKLTNKLENPPVSIFSDLKWNDPKNIDTFKREVDLHKAMCKYEFDIYTCHDVLKKNLVYKPMKLSIFDY